jgi:hypothetical protein
VEVPALRKSKIINFLVDTGSVYSAITEKEAMLMGIECAVLPDEKGEAIGFGGLFKNRIINRPVHLTFKSNKDEHKINYSSGLRVVCVPEKLDHEEREKMIRYTPCVLGMDVLRNFHTHVSKDKVELELAPDK